jgi:hypothetical protein
VALLPTAPRRHRGKPTETAGATTLLVNCMSRVTSGRQKACLTLFEKVGVFSQPFLP